MNKLYKWQSHTLEYNPVYNCVIDIDNMSTIIPPHVQACIRYMADYGVSVAVIDEDVVILVQDSA